MPVLVIGLGPGELDRLPASTRAMLADPAVTVILRTISHPAAAELADLRPVVSCDDLYESAEDFESVYSAIVDRVISHAEAGPVIYAVPGSPHIGEFAVAQLQARTTVEMVASESFLDATLATVGYDPLDRGLRILDGHNLPDPLLIDGPTIVAHLDQPVILAEAAAAIARVVDESSVVKLVIDAGGEGERVVSCSIESVDADLAGLRTSMYVDPVPGGIVGAIKTMARLRRECPWDRSQTHQSLVKNLVEESHELIDAISSLTENGLSGPLEDELGDVLLQVLFHSVIATESEGFGFEDVAENLRQKLVRRHPHVFAEVVADSPDEVKANWEKIKSEERGRPPSSALEGVPAGMPALERAAKLGRKAAKVGFDWPSAEPVFDKIAEEVAELRTAFERKEGSEIEAELGDVLFAVVNLARHLEVDPELALTSTIRKFVRRFEKMEEMGTIAGLSLHELDARWEAAKRLS